MVSTSKEISLEKQLIQMNETNQNLSLADINVFIGKVNTTLALFDSKNPSRNVYQNIFMPVLEARPKSITISQFLYADRGASAGATLGLHGIATDRAALQSFKKILEDTGKFTSVDVPISNFVKRTNIDFTLTLFIK
jgi:hypothetical protein